MDKFILKNIYRSKQTRSML